MLAIPAVSHLICTLSLTQRFYLSPVSCTYTTDDLSYGNFTAICCMYSITNENALKRAIFVRGSEGGQLVKICTQTFQRKCAWPQSGHLFKKYSNILFEILMAPVTLSHDVYSLARASFYIVRVKNVYN